MSTSASTAKIEKKQARPKLNQGLNGKSFSATITSEMSETATKEEQIVETTDKAEAGQLYLVSALVQKDDALDQLTAYLKKAGCDIKKTENLGVKNLYVPINKHHALTLVSAFFTAPAAVAHQLQQALRHEEYVERFLLTTWRGDLEARERKPRVKKETKAEDK